MGELTYLLVGRASGTALHLGWALAAAPVVAAVEVVAVAADSAEGMVAGGVAAAVDVAAAVAAGIVEEVVAAGDADTVDAGVGMGKAETGSCTGTLAAVVVVDAAAAAAVVGPDAAREKIRE